MIKPLIEKLSYVVKNQKIQLYKTKLFEIQVGKI